jgi:signal transduction histidine kinase
VGTHKVASASKASQRAREPASFRILSPWRLALRDWPVSRRLIAVIVLALVMGLVFGGLRVASADSSAAQFGRVAQLANLGQQVTGLVQALQDERDRTTGLLPVTSPKDLQHWYDATDAAAAKVRALAAGIGGSFPANIQSRVATVVSVITNLRALRSTAQASQSALAVIADYAAPIGDLVFLNDQIAQGTSDSGLVNDVQALNSLALAKDQAAQQRALLFNALNQQLFADGVQQAVITAQSEELNDLTAFDTTATAAEQSSYRNTVAGPLVNEAQGIETYILSVGSLDIGAGALGISATAAPAQWYSAMSGTVDGMQQVERGMAGSIVARAQSLQRGAEQSALFTAVLTAVILFLVLIATLAVARSLVRPLRRLREGALTIATVQLPERVRELGEATEPATSPEVAPIDVVSADEIGQVARAFDQVHSEAVRLAGNEAMLRNSFNAMFVSLSRRSQSLIERLARFIDSLEQDEGDPDRLSNLFSMDHLVTRMRRNSENLLLLAGHEGARKWSEPVSLTDVARAATSEIEQYSRVTLKIQPGIAVTGSAVSDIVHLLAEIIENATIFSAKHTLVEVTAWELATGGVLIEVSDSGVGIPEARLSEINWRLENLPVIDVSVSRHMGLFAVGRLAERHGVRVRLQARSPQGLTAMIWLPDGVTKRQARPAGWATGQFGPQAAAATRPASGGHGIIAASAAAGPPPDDAFVPAYAGAATPEPGPAAASATSDWFHRRSPVTAGSGSNPPGTASQAGSGWQSGTETSWAEGRRAAQIVADPFRGDNTAAGLPRRVPRANLLPGSAGGRHAASKATSRPADGPDAEAPAGARPRRSPEMARSRLSGFQSGARRAKGQTLREQGDPVVELRIPSGPELARHRLHHASPGHRARDRGDHGRRAARAVGGYPRWFRRTACGHHLRAGRPGAGCRADPRGRPAHSRAGGDGRRADAGHGDERRVKPGRAGRSGVRHRPGFLRDDAPGRGGRRRADTGRPRPLTGFPVCGPAALPVNLRNGRGGDVAGQDAA